ncbi:hypothetical protein ACS8YF_12590 [Salinisphaera sp. SWV1]|uniref:hypothetical protein n=1 Tax=Salinisphaera sp. SWV1 TaxID=3454139 RepID=UPI003F848817
MTIKSRLTKLEQAKSNDDMLIVHMRHGEDADAALMRHTGRKDGDEGRLVVLVERFSSENDPQEKQSA